MSSAKEKRLHERIALKNLSGAIEIKESMKPITILNVSEDGLCIAGAEFPVGSVVRLAITPSEDMPDISLYCKVVWATESKTRDKKSGLLLLNTNKILFKKDLATFGKLIDTVKK